MIIELSVLTSDLDCLVSILLSLGRISSRNCVGEREMVCVGAELDMTYMSRERLQQALLGSHLHNVWDPCSRRWCVCV